MPIAKFLDLPDPERLENVLNGWRYAANSAVLPGRLKVDDKAIFGDISPALKKSLASLRSARSRKRRQKQVIDWLYTLVRGNVRRGRIFDLREVIAEGQADCLGYAKLLTVLGRECGLDLGVVEVIIDTRGENVPHTAVLVKLADGKPQVVDFWYGSPDIHHKKLGLSILRGGSWQIADVDSQTLKKSDVSYLPDAVVNGITLYIEGNRSLKRGDYAGAVAQYTQAARLYPSNARIYYNRAIARENLGQKKRAEADYARALRDEPALTRNLATQPAEIVDLIKLDENHVPEQTQRIYLTANGFITGRQMSIAELSRRFALYPATVTRLLCSTLS